MRSPTASSSFRFTGFHATLMIVAFFAVIVSVNVLMAFAAGRSWTGLVVRNSYVASQHFDERLAEGRARAALGWTSSFAIEGGVAVWRLDDARRMPVLASPVSAKFMHPVAEGGDRVVTLGRREDGRYAAPVSLTPGQWAVRLTAEAGLGAPFEDYRRILVDEKGNAR